MDFLDVPGASGTRYRFRRTTVAELPAAAGAVVAVAGPPARQRFLLCAATPSLSRAASAIDATLQSRSAQVFIRLNVSRAVRDAEHADIVAAIRPETDLLDLD